MTLETWLIQRINKDGLSFSPRDNPLCTGFQETLMLILSLYHQQTKMFPIYPRYSKISNLFSSSLSLPRLRDQVTYISLTLPNLGRN